MRIPLLFFILFFALQSIAQNGNFKFTLHSDVPSIVFIKTFENVSFPEIDSIKVGTSAHHSLSIKQGSIAIIETDLQQLPVWVLPGYSLVVNIKDGQVSYSGKAAIFASYLQNKQVNFINFCHYYQLRNPDYNETPEGYTNFLDSLSKQQINYLSNYFGKVQTAVIKEFMKDEWTTIYYENLHRKLLFGEFNLQKFNAVSASTGSVRPYLYAEKIDFNDPAITRNLCFQLFSGQLIADISSQKQNAMNPKQSLTQYLSNAINTIEKLSNNQTSRVKLQNIFFSKTIDDLERKGKMDLLSEMDIFLTSIQKKEDQAQVRVLKERIRGMAVLNP